MKIKFRYILLAVVFLFIFFTSQVASANMVNDTSRVDSVLDAVNDVNSQSKAVRMEASTKTVDLYNSGQLEDSLDEFNSDVGVGAGSSYIVNLNDGSYDGFHYTCSNNASNLTINGGGRVIKYDNSVSNFLYVSDNTNVTLKDMIIRPIHAQNASTEVYGAICNYGNLVLCNVSFISNRDFHSEFDVYYTSLYGDERDEHHYIRYDSMGGAVRNYGTLGVVNSTFTNNTAYQASAIYSQNACVNISSSNFTDNSVYLNYTGSGISTREALISSSFFNNSQLNFIKSKARVTDNTFQVNTSSVLSLRTSNVSFSNNRIGYLGEYHPSLFLLDESITDYYPLDEKTYTFNGSKLKYENNTVNGNNTKPRVIINTTLCDDITSQVATLKVRLTSPNNDTVNYGEVKAFFNTDELEEIGYTMGFCNMLEYTIPLSKVKMGTNKIKVVYGAPSEAYFQNAVYEEDIIKDKSYVDVQVADASVVFGERITLNATVTSHAKAVNDGYILFKINGVTVKDKKSNPVYVPVRNGFASLNYSVPATWSKNIYHLTAKYRDSPNYYDKLSNAATIKTVKRTAKIALTITPDRGVMDDVVTFTARINDTITPSTGVVIFKFQGATIKDINGTVKVRVINGVAKYNFTLPHGTSGKSSDGLGKKYNITVVYSNIRYNRMESNATLTGLKSDVVVKLNKAVVKGRTVTLTGRLRDPKGHNVRADTYTVIKLGKTLIRNSTNGTYHIITNGVINITFTLPNDFRMGNYTLTLIGNERNCYKTAKATTNIMIN